MFHPYSQGSRETSTTTTNEAVACNSHALPALMVKVGRRLSTSQEKRFSSNEQRFLCLELNERAVGNSARNNSINRDLYWYNPFVPVGKQMESYGKFCGNKWKTFRGFFSESRYPILIFPPAAGKFKNLDRKWCYLCSLEKEHARIRAKGTTGDCINRTFFEPLSKLHRNKNIPIKQVGKVLSHVSR